MTSQVRLTLRAALLSSCLVAWSLLASRLHEPFACAVWSDPGIVFDEANANVNYWEPWYLGYEKGVRRPAGVPNADRPRTGLYKRLVDAGRGWRR